jgi:UDP-glucose 4-epimerase
MLNVLITGGNGYIGSMLIEKLILNKNYNIYTLNKNIIHGKKIKLISLKKKYKNIKFDNIFLLGFNNDLILHETKIKNTIVSNYLYFDKLIKFINNHIKKNSKVIFTSSASLLGNKYNYKNNDKKTELLSFYDLNKLFIENYLEFNSNLNKNFNLTILRITNVYGETNSKQFQKNRGFINNVIKKMVNKDVTTIFGDGKYKRNYIHISDVIDALIIAMKNNKIYGKTLILNSKDNYKLIEVIYKIKHIIETLSEDELKLIFINNESSSNKTDFRNFSSSDNTFSKHTGWKLKHNIENSLRGNILKKIK